MCCFFPPTVSVYAPIEAALRGQLRRLSAAPPSAPAAAVVVFSVRVKVAVTVREAPRPHLLFGEEGVGILDEGRETT